MPTKFDANRPIYQQIMDRIKQMLISGESPPGSKIQSVRELALQFEVNPNTVQKALAELEREGYLYTQRTAGRFVTEDGDLLAQLKRQRPNQIVRKFIDEMLALGITKEQLIDIVQEALKEE